MKFHRIIIVFVILSALCGVFSSATATAETETARCAVRSFDGAYSSSKAVFVGKVLSESKSGDVRTFVFEVEKYWKGANKKKIEINVYETPRYQANFQKDERYLIYADGENEGKLSVGRCSRSRSADEANEDLEKLGTGKKPD